MRCLPQGTAARHTWASCVGPECRARYDRQGSLLRRSTAGGTQPEQERPAGTVGRPRPSSCMSWDADGWSGTGVAERDTRTAEERRRGR